MPRQAQKLLTGEKVPVDIPRTVATGGRVERNTGRSGEDTLLEEAERIASYLGVDFRDLIYNKGTADLAIKRLLEDPNFSNLFGNVSKEGMNTFKDYLIGENREENLDRITKGEIVTKIGIRRSGEYVADQKYYAIVVDIMGRKQVQFRSYKTGQLVSYKEISDSL